MFRKIVICGRYYLFLQIKIDLTDWNDTWNSLSKHSTELKFNK